MKDNIICETCNQFNIKDLKPWFGKEQFIERLKEVQNILIEKEKFRIIPVKRCQICDKKIASIIFQIDRYKWDAGYVHYIKIHNVRPSEKFIDFIYRFKKTKKIMKRIFQFKSNRYVVNDMSYVKLKKNQILIMDALMIHGGYTKKYFDKENLKHFKYSEHYGLLDFNEYSLERVIISGHTSRIDKEDEEIFLPKELQYAYEYEYMFHTHPPTPKPGGRAYEHVLYEFPSVGDMLSFINLFNKGLTQGSIVITPEGLYNIRKFKFNKVKIRISEKKFYEEITGVIERIQERAIKKYGTDFTTHVFYSQIAQDVSFIKHLNEHLRKYRLFIDYYPRSNINGKWIIDTIYLPIYVIDKK